MNRKVQMLIAGAGAAAGIYASYVWWNGWPPIGPLARTRAAAGGVKSP